MLNLTGYWLTFDDEFDSLSISQNGTGTVWSDIRPGSRMGPNADIGFGNSAFVDPASGVNPFSLQNGALQITATRADSSVAGPAQWASGLISTMGSFSQLYGYFEMRAQLPAETGVWPAFWMLSADGKWPPEIDALEAYGDGNLYQYTHTAQTGQHTYEQTWTAHQTMTSGYHTYGVMWNAQTVTFYFDGEVTGQQATPSDMHGRMYMLADLAMQMKPGVTDVPKHLNVDYIRVYSNDHAAAAVALSPVSSPDGADTSSMYGAASLGPSPPGQGALTLHVSGDHYAGDPQFQVFVDGRQVGGTQSVTAVHANGQWQDISVSGDFNPAAAHHVEVRFINDAWDGRGGEGHDRNLYIGSITMGTQVIAGTDASSNTASYGNNGLDPHAAVMAGNGTVAFDTSTGTSSGGTPPPSPVPQSGTLSLRVSGDHYAGDPQFQVVVDGRQVGGTQSVTAVHANGQWQDISVSGDFDPAAAHHVEVRFINDAWDGRGGEGHDRNLYVGSITMGTQVIAGTNATSNTASYGNNGLDPHAAVMAGNGTVAFDTSSTAGTTPTPPPAPPSHPPVSGALSLHVSGDHYAGDPQFQVFVDGHQVGGTQSVSAVHANGQWQDISISGDFDPSASHHVDVRFINDAWDGRSGEGHDRNLYIGSIAMGTHLVAGTEATSNTGSSAYGNLDPHAAVMVGNGTASFEFHGSDWFLI
jgi:beta-glucanase (GH16 family)/glutaredoxin-related protein